MNRPTTESRPTTDTERHGLKTALKRLVALLGGIEAASTVTRVQRSNLSDYGAVQLPDRHVPVDVVLDLERIAGVPLVTEALAGAQGFLLLPMSIGEGDVADALSTVSKDAGKTLGDAMQALRDGLPDSERAVLIADLTELVRASNHALGLLRQQHPRPLSVAASRS